jgi:hypothetical protein
LHLRRYRFAIESYQELVVHAVATKRVDKVQLEIEPCHHPNVHHIGVPLLIRYVGTKVILTARGFRSLPAREQIRIA